MQLFVGLAPFQNRCQKFGVSADTDINTKNSEYLLIPISIRYQKFGVSADTDIDPIPKIRSICRYRYRSDTKNSEYLPIPISVRYQPIRYR